GRIQNAVTDPSSIRAIETANGRVQLPVRSRIQPKATGDNMPATAPAAFISALELPAYSGAMSVVAIHIGEIAVSRKNKAAVKAAIPGIRSWTRIAGTSAMRARIRQTLTSSERAIRLLPVRRSR